MEDKNLEGIDLTTYRELTRKGDWKGIFEFNSGKLDGFGTRKELSVLDSYLEKDETVIALASGIIRQSGSSNSSDFGSNTWLVALTNERFLFLDHALLSGSVDTQSIRLDRVQAVSASQGWLLGKISVDIGARVVVVDNCQKQHVAVMADLANKLLRQQQMANGNASVTTADHASQSSDFLKDLERLGELRKSGVLTEEEFAAAKAKILSN